MKRNDSLVAALRARVAETAAFGRALRGLDQERVELTGLPLEARALMLAALVERSERKVAVIVPGDASLGDFESALRLFHPDSARMGSYPTPSLSPYQDVAHSLAVTREELRTLAHLMRGDLDTLVVPARALFRRLPAPKDFSARMMIIRPGDELDLHPLLDRLVSNGFVRTDLVGEVGEFAFRGGILDLFPANADLPSRIELFGDTVESIRLFDPVSQRSEERLSEVRLLPLAPFAAGPAEAAALAAVLADFAGERLGPEAAGHLEALRE
ncbi:MAG TPA: hypothetical protein VM534_11515, partial [Thermoanaerobaculia bacterium]|nr:hypothetical protein [Thermoanaerobaculia bacterium]